MTEQTVWFIHCLTDKIFDLVSAPCPFPVEVGVCFEGGMTHKIGAEQVPSFSDIVVVGAGFGGLYAHYRFRQLGMSVFGFEAADDVGGTWYWNRYPGARCDVESVDYCYSFSPALLEEWEWSERFATQPEILRYAGHVAEKYDLRRDIAFARRVVEAVFDEAGAVWVVETDHGERITCRYLVTTVGCLSLPKDPGLDGLENFEGQWVLTSAWPQDKVDWAGKRVAVIGTGSSAIQAIPIIAEDAARLTVFQRTPNYSVPAYNGPVPPERLAEVRQNYPVYMDNLRQTPGGQIFPGVTNQSALSFTGEEREELYERAWKAGRWTIQSLFNDNNTDAEANRLVAEFVAKKIRDQVDDPAVAEKLIPHGYPFGTKRLCLDTNYYATFNRDNVELVDIRQTPIERITARGIRTSGSDYDVDLIVFAIGFDAITGPLLALGIKGRNGLTLKEAWKDGPTSYLGLTIAGFPNLFTVNGPSSPSVLTNMILSVEHHVDLIAECIDHMRGHGFDRIEATSEAAASWAEETRLIAEQTLFPNANSWYMGANIPGKPRLFLAYMGGLDHYIGRCKEIVADDFRGFTMAAKLPAEEVE